MKAKQTESKMRTMAEQILGIGRVDGWPGWQLLKGDLLQQQTKTNNSCKVWKLQNKYEIDAKDNAEWNQVHIRLLKSLELLRPNPICHSCYAYVRLDSDARNGGK